MLNKNKDEIENEDNIINPKNLLKVNSILMKFIPSIIRKVSVHNNALAILLENFLKLITFLITQVY